ncbi:MAG TPA: hypothetical protein VF783_22770 [Terriglobales bacterium]
MGDAAARRAVLNVGDPWLLLFISHDSLAKQAFYSLSAHHPCWAFFRRVFSPLQNLIEPDSVLDCWALDLDREFRHSARTGHDWVFTEFCNRKRDRLKQGLSLDVSGVSDPVHIIK